MTETIRGTFKPLGVTGVAFGNSDQTFSYSRMGINGTTVTKTDNYVDSAVIPPSTALKTAFSQPGATSLDGILTPLAAAVSPATTATQGNTKVDDDAGGDPVALTTTGTLAARIPSAAIYNALTGSAQTPDYGNAFVTRYEMQLALSLGLGSGKDGHGKLGAIAASSTAPTITSVATAGLLTGTYTYKIAAYNLSGAIIASSASASTGAIAAKQVRLTLPALPANGMGWRIYRSTGGNYELVGIAVLGFNYTETASDARRYIWDDNQPYPNASQTAPGSDTTGSTATLSGRFDFITLDLTGATAITVATSGATAGTLDCRVQGLYTPAAGCTITAVGANRVNIGHLRRFANQTTAGVGGHFTAHTTATATFTPATVSAMAVTIRAFGLGADASQVGMLYSGFGTKGNSNGGGTGGDGGYGGGLIRIWCYQIANNSLVGTYAVTGGVGSAGSAVAGAQQGGGGGAGGTLDFGAVVPWRDAATENAAGGVGGAATGTGGANTATGSPGGAGGEIVRRGCVDITAVTATVAAGSNGASNATGSAVAPSGYVYSGGHYGDGGYATGSSAVASATAGQTFNLNGLFDPSPIFAA